MLANGGELDGARILGRKTIELMTANHLPGRSDLASLSKSLFSETTNAGVGFGLGFAVTQDVARTMIPGSAGDILGRHVHDRLLRRPGRAAAHGLHDPVEPVDALPDPSRAEDADLFGPEAERERPLGESRAGVEGRDRRSGRRRRAEARGDDPVQATNGTSRWPRRCEGGCSGWPSGISPCCSFRIGMTWSVRFFTKKASSVRR